MATGRGPHAGQVKGDDPDKKGYPGPPGWGLGIGLTTPTCNTLICFETSTEASERRSGEEGIGFVSKPQLKPRKGEVEEKVLDLFRNLN
jgi:hypothetical protein